MRSVSRHGERGWARALYAIGAEGDERLLRRLLHREIEFLYGSKPIAAGHQHVFQLGAGKYGCRGLFQCSLGGTREGLVDAIELPRLRIGELLLAEEEVPRHGLVMVRHLDGAPGGEGLEPVVGDVPVPMGACERLIRCAESRVPVDHAVTRELVPSILRQVVEAIVQCTSRSLA